MTYLELFQKYIEYHKDSVTKKDRRDPVTIKAYRNKYDMFKQYLTYRNSINLLPEEFTIKIADQYFEYLIRKKYGNNYSVRCAEILKTVMKFGVRKEFIKINSISEFKQAKDKPGKPKYITSRELRLIEDYQPVCGTVSKAKSMFLFQCYTGVDYGDLIRIRRSNITEYKGREFLIKNRNKSTIEAYIPYSDKCADLFKANGYRMDLLSNGKYNEALKTLAEECDIHKHLISHMGRKTFAMHKLNNSGYSIEAVSKMLGHNSIKTTETYYAQVELELVYQEFNKIEDSR